MEIVKSLRMATFRGMVAALFFTALSCTNRAPALFYISGPDFLKNQGAKISIYNGLTLMGSASSAALRTNTFDLFPGLYRVKVEIDEELIFWTNDFYFPGLGSSSPQEIPFPHAVTPIAANQWRAGQFKTVSNGANVEYQIYSFSVAAGLRTNFIYSDAYLDGGSNTAVIDLLTALDDSYFFSTGSAANYLYPRSVVTSKAGTGYVLLRCYSPGTYAIKISN